MEQKNDIDFHMGTATFHISMEAAASKTKYQGLFKVKCVLDPLEYIQSDSMYRKLLGDTNPQFASDYVSQLCYALSQLKYRIIDCPAWFKNQETGVNGSNIDDSILLYVLDKAVECESDYREGMKEKYEQAMKAVKTSIDDGTLNDGSEQEKVKEEEDQTLGSDDEENDIDE
jgi:hypothetical protein